MFQFHTEMRLKSLHKKDLIKAKKKETIIVDSIMDQLVPQVSSLKTPNMFDSLTKLFEEEEHKLEKIVEEYEDPKCRTT